MDEQRVEFYHAVVEQKDRELESLRREVVRLTDEVRVLQGELRDQISRYYDLKQQIQMAAGR